ncbi:MAG: glycosyltransferase [Bacteroidales bacterium]|nr:glycosyltransferase [Bacteroidales bacterium]
MYFLLISDVLPDAAKTGGEIVLYRHLIEHKFLDFEVITPTTIRPIKWWKKIISRFFTRLEKTRFRSWIHPCKPLYDLYDWDHMLIERLKKNRPAFILTVAHGRGCFKALDLSKKLQIPLVTIFHDFYPYSVFASKMQRALWEYEFRQLYRQSQLVFVITEAMLKRLGKHPNAYLLPPVPSTFLPVDEHVHPEKYVMIYAGLCGGAYRNMIEAVLPLFESTQNLELHLAGSESEYFKIKQSDQIHAHGFVDEDRLAVLLSQAQFLLVLIPFDRAREHFATHFPSKLVEYAKYKKCIIIWGPEYSTAVRWGIDNASAMVVDQNNPEALVESIKKLMSDVHLQNQIASNAFNYFQTHWNPPALHKLFSEKIFELINKC